MTTRLIDANLNRLKEGLRVIEDISRYILNDKDLTTRIKSLRHKATYKKNLILLQSRDINNDVLKHTTIPSEEKRENIQSIILANSKRAEESARVLEEILKLESVKLSQIFKEIRYETYDIEKVLYTHISLLK